MLRCVGEASERHCPRYGHRPFDGQRKGSGRWRARYPDPRGKSSTAQIERTFRTKERRADAPLALLPPPLQARRTPRAPPHKRELRFHDLRHTCASLLIAQGAHPKLIQTRLGHFSITVTLDRYGHLFPSVEAALAEKLDAVFAAAAPVASGRPIDAAISVEVPARGVRA